MCRSIWQEAHSLYLPLGGLGADWKQEKSRAWEGRTAWTGERMEENGFPEPGRNFINYTEQKERKKFFLAMKKDPLPPTHL